MPAKQAEMGISELIGLELFVHDQERNFAVVRYLLSNGLVEEFPEEIIVFQQHGNHIGVGLPYKFH